MNTSNITNYKPKDFAELLGVSVKTLQRWDREGTLKANRTPTDRRYYTYGQYLQFKGINTEDDTRQVVIYARVSTRNQTLSWVRIKEKGYIPTTKDGYIIKSGSVSIKADKFYVSVLVEIPDAQIANNSNEGIGIDLGLKDFAIVSNGKTYKNINKSARLKKLEKQLIREQRRLSRKYENLKKGEVTQRANIQKQKLKVQKLHHKIDNVRTDYINKTIAEIVKTKPSYITIEDLNVKGMMKNRYLSKSVASQKFYEFRAKLPSKCNENGIELRVVARWYPSSKMCHRCGRIKRDLKLSDRIYRCECGYVEDRDFNAALNLRDAITYEVA